MKCVVNSLTSITHCTSQLEKHPNLFYQNMYVTLTGDHSTARSAAEKEVDERIMTIAQETFELDDPEILFDLRKLNIRETRLYYI